MKKVNDLFGKALQGYLQGDRSKFFFVNQNGKRYTHQLSRYFRNYSKLTRLEKRIISLAKGDILDVGCGTGMYIPYLSKKGKVLGIDISPKVVAIARMNGVKNVFIKDIFNLKRKKKYDTIVLLENNLGIAGTIEKAGKLLKILKNLLKKNGQILTNCMNVPNQNYFEAEVYPIWKEEQGKKFKWISFNPLFLNELCNKFGLRMKVIKRDKWFYLARITKRNNVDSS